MATPNATPRKKPRSRRLWWLIGTGVVLLLAIPTGLTLYLLQEAEDAFAEALAEIDRIDPGWRLEEIEANRKVVSDQENGALHILTVKKLIPPLWANAEDFHELLDREAPPHRLDEAQLKMLRSELGKVVKARAEALKMVDYPQGRFPINYTIEYWTTQLLSNEARSVAYVLSLDALLLAQEGGIDEALVRCHAMFNVSRAVGDEPFLISTLIRVALRSIVVQRLEYILSQGVASDEKLRMLQQLLEEDEPEPLLYIGLRGERAGFDRLVEAVQEGKVPRKEIAALVGTPGLNKLSTILGLNIARLRATSLYQATKVIEAAKLPRKERTLRWNQLQTEFDKEPTFATMMTYTQFTVADATDRCLAQLRCAIVALAAERYRLKHGQWPADLPELVKTGYLPAVPLDPFDEAPLRWLRTKDGVIVYALGKDGMDDGGKIDRNNQGENGTDLGFLLWDEPARRQPPLPPPQVDAPPPDAGVPPEIRKDK